MKKILLLLIILLVLVGILASPFFIKINNLNCTSQFGACSSDIKNDLDGIELGSLRDSKKKVQSTLLKHKKVKEFAINYTFPKTLNVVIVERKPQVAILRKNATNYILIDKDGTILEESDSTTFPIIAIQEVGHTNSELSFAANLQYELFINFNVNSSIMKKDHLLITKDGVNFLLPLKGDLDVVLGSYNLILSWLKSEKEKSRIDKVNAVYEVDLRYKNPVMRI